VGAVPDITPCTPAFIVIGDTAPFGGNRMISLQCKRFIPVVLAVSALVGCGSEPPAKTADDVVPATTAAVATTAAAPKGDTATPTSGSVHIEQKILAACGDIPEARFAFDSARIEAQAERALTALAKCFVSGPLAGKNMKLVGHTDPRGESGYNYALGQQRAGSVASFLSTKGLEASHIATSSMGENEASGTDEDGWAKDRKVDVFLGD
jgi:peptidoglycan-associated lipoprotein